jgi:hypothetical protein
MGGYRVKIRRGAREEDFQRNQIRNHKTVVAYYY